MARSTYDDFIVREKVGHGSYGVVYKVVRKVDRMLYAMKEIDLQGMSRKEQEECIRETRVLSSLDSDYIIKYYDSFLERGKLYIITEYASNGNLHDYIKKQKQVLPEELIWKLFVQILLGLNHMHSKKILHRDIKTLNVFLDDDLNVKLGDMGVAKILSTHTNFAKTIVGTPYYLSPELCEDKPYNEKSDVWALGVVLYECCVQRHPFDADNQGALILKILRGKYPPVVGYSPDVSDVIKRCLTQNANRRPNTYKLLLLPCVRQKAEELGISVPDQQSLLAMAERSSTTKLTRTPSAGRGGGQAAGNRPPSSQGPAPAAAAGAIPAAAAAPGGAASAESAPAGALKPDGGAAGVGGAGVIRVVGNMDQPPQAAVAAAAAVSNEDKAFVFGGTIKASGAGAGAIPAAQQKAEDQGVGGNGPPAPSSDALPGDGWLVGARPAAAVVAAAAAAQGPEASAAPAAAAAPAAGAGGGPGGATVAGATAGVGGLQLDDEEEGEEEDGHNPYDDPYRPEDEGEEGEEAEEDYDGGAEGEGDEEEEEEDYDEDYDEEGAEGMDENHPASSSGGWQPDPVRLQHMRSAMMLQRAACLDLIGDKAFNELYALLKSNQVDEASMTDLSRLVFKIIPYDKSEVIQMMYKLLYLESQLENGGQ